MKSIRPIITTILLATLGMVTWSPAFAASPLANALPAGGADEEYAAALAQTKAQPPAPPTEMGREKLFRWVDESRQQTTALALAFYAAHPTDPRRWELVLAAANAAPLFAQSIGADVTTKGLAAVVADQAAKAAWQAKIDGLKEALLASGDAPVAMREQVEWGRFGRDFVATTKAKQTGQPYDYAPFKARFAAHLVKYAGQPTLPDRASDYLGALEKSMPGEGTAGWKELAQSPDEALRARAEKELAFAARRAALAAKPLDLAFTAVDGRPVDVAALRGKVVLVDFWATWCGPCIAELPNVKKVYAAYHSKGFEVVGISLENGKLAPKDTAEQAAAKLEAAKKVLTDFTTREQMPWPQYFDGKWWKNDISTKYEIQAIPAMFLLDQEGKVVSTNARGEALEHEVKRLLKL